MARRSAWKRTCSIFRRRPRPKRIEVRFWERLREEKKFNGPEELRAANRFRYRPR